MPKHDTKTCPRCKASFKCKVELIQQCQCSSVFLTPSEQDYVSTRYDNCLCISCLVEVQTECSVLNSDNKKQHVLRH